MDRGNFDFAALATADEHFYNIQKHTHTLAALERRSSYDDFDKSTRYCMKILEDAGFEQIERVVHRADGKTAACDMIMPEAWDLAGRSFLQITNRDVSEFDSVLADSDLNPVAALIWSAPTPPGGIDAEIVDYDSLEDKVNPDVAGKFVLYAHHTGFARVYRQVAAAGAVGLALSDMAGETVAPNDLYWFNGQGCFGWYLTKEDKKLPLFSLSPIKARMLTDLLKKGPVTVHAEMNTRLYDSNIYTVTGIIPGADSEEYALLAHVYEPFAGDDAQGAALAAEIGTVLRKSGLKPQKTLRVVLSMELFGFAAYMAENERYKNIVAALSLDGFTHCCSPEISLRLSPISSPFFGDFLYRENGKRLQPDIQWGEKFGSLSDDTFAGDECMSVPVNWLYNPSGIHHHNTGSGFLPDWQLTRERFPMLADSVLQLICRTNFPDYAPLALAEYCNDIHNILQRDDLPAREKAFRLRAKCEFQTARLGSVRKFDKSYSFDAEAFCELRDRALATLPEFAALSELEQELSRIVPVRHCLCSPSSLAKVPLAEKRAFHSVSIRPLFAQFDGKRTLFDAILRLESDSGSISTPEVRQNTLDMLRYLEKYGYVTLKVQA